MNLAMRVYQTEDDYWRIRAFLRKVFLINGRRELSWQAARFDYWRWHGIENLGDGRLEEDVFLWELADGQIAAVLNREGPGDAFLQMHPDHRTPELEEEMLIVAEGRLAVPGDDGRRRLHVWANEHDDARHNILMRRGYAKGEWPDAQERQRQRSLDRPIPEAPPAPGYTVRSLGDVDELPARSWLSWRAFHPDAPDEDYDGGDWYRNIQRAPLYRRDLDIVAVAPNGELAAFCTIWYDDVTRTGYFEPVGTEPTHQQRGLGKTVMCEAMRRLQRLGGTLATVGGGSPAANALYGSVVSPEYELFEPWVRVLS
ncbi:MAG: GNAT family N-acetyltransferase [Chloroflexi bacterium]|nr:GNAT family N-acetyltransferase [Chloroflexota bacterium]MBU1750059.1 GNAT family N-acetyltransferase [Chloroflexota bacterium]MBU1879144.1 GNAT family N-acetyltransferase [Chloroflexota bacterium]